VGESAAVPVHCPPATRETLPGCVEGASGRFARAGEAVTPPVRYLSVLAFSTASRTEGWQVDARAATGAGPALR